jgi:hypothetical protein
MEQFIRTNLARIQARLRPARQGVRAEAQGGTT